MDETGENTPIDAPEVEHAQQEKAVIDAAPIEPSRIETRPQAGDQNAWTTVVTLVALVALCVWSFTAVARSTSNWRIPAVLFLGFAATLYLRTAGALITKFAACGEGTPWHHVVDIAVVAGVWGGAWIIRTGSEHDNRTLAAIGGALLFTALFSAFEQTRAALGVPKRRLTGMESAQRSKPPHVTLQRVGRLVILVISSVVALRWLLGFPFRWCAIAALIWAARQAFARWQVTSRQTSPGGEEAIAPRLAFGLRLPRDPSGQYTVRELVVSKDLASGLVALVLGVAVMAFSGTVIWLFNLGLVTMVAAFSWVSSRVALRFEFGAPPRRLRVPIDAGDASSRRREASSQLLQLDPERTPLTVTVAMLAAFAVAGGGVLFKLTVLNHTTWGGVFAIGAAFAIAGVVFIAQGEGYVMALVVMVAAVWSISNRDAQEPTWPVDPGSTPIVVLGDSYSSGEGANTFIAGTNDEGANNCRRAPTAWGVLVATELRRPLIMYSCSGATADKIALEGQVADTVAPTEPPSTADTTVTSEVFRQSDFNGVLAGSRPQLDNLETQTAATVNLVLLSIGGNDALFSAIGAACAVPGSCTNIRDDLRDNLAVNVGPSVHNALVEVLTSFPNATIGVVGYPDALRSPTGDSNDACDSSGAPAGAPLSGGEICLLREFLQQLNGVIKAQVDEINADDQSTAAEPRVVWLGGTTSAFAGAGDEKTTNMVRLEPTDGTTVFARLLPSHWIHNTFHPTEAGHERIAAQVLAGLCDLDQFNSATTCTSHETAANENVEALASNDTVSASTAEAYREGLGDTAVRLAQTGFRRALIIGLPLMIIGWLAGLFGRFAKPVTRRARGEGAT